MQQFPSNIRFVFTWRKYQKRALDELEVHLNDNHLHLIAPPGSGKTVLGLEVAIRLNKPTLIFAPTIAIRNQWIHRFCESFLQVKQKPGWISRDINKPAFLTVSTYQALHAACNGNRFIDGTDSNDVAQPSTTAELIRKLRSQNIGTIVLDEAHHLKNVWWKSLIEIKNALNPTVVGLTATPPYDVSYAEWQRYMELNGPIDAEISVPELVVEGDLCPHQDYVVFSLPTVSEQQRIVDRRERIRLLFQEIIADEALIAALEQNSIFVQPQEHLEWIYGNLEFYASVLIYLNAVGISISKEHLEIVGDKNLSIPPLSYEWIEILLRHYLFLSAELFGIYADHREKLIKQLKRSGALENRSVHFHDDRKITKVLTGSLSKLDSIRQIADFEHGCLGRDLRMVILTDFIRKEFLYGPGDSSVQINKIGVIPIFEHLRRNMKSGVALGVLTGSIIIIPVNALSQFRKVATKYQIYEISVAPLGYADEYVVISPNQSLKNQVVHIVTQVFQAGYIEVLVGTKSLLGEGWDAPAINSLILASFVGSYVLSNQMRGRAIRIDRQNINKTSNIWHLVCIDPADRQGGDDWHLLRRRFKAFVGVSFKEEVGIENGINRLDLPQQPFDDQDCQKVNNTMFFFAGRRYQLRKNWEIALSSGVSLVEEIEVPFAKGNTYNKLKSFYYTRTIAYLMATLISGIIGFGLRTFIRLIRALRHINSKEELYFWLMITGILGVLSFGGMTIRTLRIYIKYRDIAKDVHNIGLAILDSLIAVNAIKTVRSQLEVVSHVEQSGAIHCRLEGATTYETSIFLKSLEEIISSIENPRYLIVRKGLFLKLISQKDYHSVPEILGRKKTTAAYFQSQWKRFVGRCELIYTRTIEGRKYLLQARINSLASEFQDKTERLNKWR